MRICAESYLVMGEVERTMGHDACMLVILDGAVEGRCFSGGGGVHVFCVSVPMRLAGFAGHDRCRREGKRAADQGGGTAQEEGGPGEEEVRFFWGGGAAIALSQGMLLWLWLWLSSTLGVAGWFDFCVWQQASTFRNVIKNPALPIASVPPVPLPRHLQPPPLSHEL